MPTMKGFTAYSKICRHFFEKVIKLLDNCAIVFHGCSSLVIIHTKER